MSGSKTEWFRLVMAAVSALLPVPSGCQYSDEITSRRGESLSFGSASLSVTAPGDVARVGVRITGDHLPDPFEFDLTQNGDTWVG